MNHTPGPWRVSEEDHDQWDYGVIYGIEEDGEEVPVISMSSECMRESPQTRADARLIAAAPDMLAALERVVADMKEMDIVYGEEVACDMLCNIHSVIAKAKGESE